MKKLILVFCVVLVSCSEKVYIGTTDGEPPLVKIHSIQSGEISTSSSEETNRVEVDVLETQNVGFAASAKDTLAVKELKIDVLQNGNFEIQSTLTSTFTKSGTVSGNQGVDNIFIGGILKPDSFDQPMIIKATGEDFAGNRIMTPPLQITFVKPVLARFTADRTTITRGEEVVLTWETENATEVLLNTNSTGTFNGSKVVEPQVTTEYTLQAINQLSTDSKTLTVTVNQPPQSPDILDFNASPGVLTSGQLTTLNWNVRNRN